jgi:tetratricopeptide (TPR) repeat protein
MCRIEILCQPSLGAFMLCSLFATIGIELAANDQGRKTTCLSGKNIVNNSMALDLRKVRASPSFIFLFFLLFSCAGLTLRTAVDEFDEGMTSFNQGNYENAIPHFQKAAELDPNYGRAYLYLGRSYLNLRKWVEAIPPLRTAFRLSPDESGKEVLNILLDALLGAATSQLKKGNFLESINYLKEGLSLEPGSMQIRNELITTLIDSGNHLLSYGNYKDAISTFSEAAELSPGNSVALIGLARAFLENGDFLKAIQAVQKVLSVDPGNEAANSLFRDIRTHPRH